MSNLRWALASFSLFAGAFNAEIFRSGLEAVPTATEEAAESLGYTRIQSLATSQCHLPCGSACRHWATI